MSLPGSSKAALPAAGTGDSAMLALAATAGNSPGSVVNWILGHFLARFRDRGWFPVDARSFERAAAWYARNGAWPLLFAWVPVVGDPLTVVAGAMRTDMRWFAALVTLGKALRYAAIAGAFSLWSA
jgi:membrane protein YqaA with SNARE-associated domain